MHMVAQILQYSAIVVSCDLLHHLWQLMCFAYITLYLLLCFHRQWFCSPCPLFTSCSLLCLSCLPPGIPWLPQGTAVLTLPEIWDQSDLSCVTNGFSLPFCTLSSETILTTCCDHRAELLFMTCPPALFSICCCSLTAPCSNQMRESQYPAQIFAFFPSLLSFPLYIFFSFLVKSLPEISVLVGLFPLGSEEFTSPP